ncbi:hypothetical protein EV363DRAFT_1302647 [Boletus edulis]|nr:hypothetical protein EV363DRAFT_1302647 [Boletus edulis]
MLRASGSHTFHGKLKLEKRIFGRNENVDDIPNDDIIDDKNWLTRIAHKWRLLPSLPVFGLKEKQGLHKIHSLELANGDFVEAEFEFTLFLDKRNPFAKQLKIYPCLKHVIRLSPNQDDQTSLIKRKAPDEEGGNTSSSSKKQRVDTLHESVAKDETSAPKTHTGSLSSSTPSESDFNLPPHTKTTDNKDEPQVQRTQANDMKKKEKPSSSPAKLIVTPMKSTLKNIINRLCSANAEDKYVAHYNEELKRRIDVISHFANDNANVYALGKIPLISTWGTYSPMNDHTNEICNPNTNEPIIVWIVGHLTSVWFIRQGEPDRQASITVMPLSDALADQGTRMISAMSDGTVKPFRVTRWQSSAADEIPQLFDAVYDAREVLRPKLQMETYPTSDLKKHDLVVVEVIISKYRTKDGTGKDGNMKWSGHRAQYELQAIYLLNSADTESSTVNERAVSKLQDIEL